MFFFFFFFQAEDGIRDKLVTGVQTCALPISFTTRIELNIDGILMVCVGLLIGGLFSLMLFVIAREQGWLPTRRKQSESAATTASTETPRTSMPAAPKAAAPSSAQSKSPAQEAR